MSDTCTKVRTLSINDEIGDLISDLTETETKLKSLTKEYNAKQEDLKIEYEQKREDCLDEIEDIHELIEAKQHVKNSLKPFRDILENIRIESKQCRDEAATVLVNNMFNNDQQYHKLISQLNRFYRDIDDIRGKVDITIHSDAKHIDFKIESESEYFNNLMSALVSVHKISDRRKNNKHARRKKRVRHEQSTRFGFKKRKTDDF